MQQRMSNAPASGDWSSHTLIELMTAATGRVYGPKTTV
jgi:hypothetical protein